MSIDWKTLLMVAATAVLSAGGTVGAQTFVGTAPHAQIPTLHIVKGMTGLCIRIEDHATPGAKVAAPAREAK